MPTAPVLRPVQPVNVWTSTARILVVVAAVGLLLTAAGAFGTSRMPVIARGVYWVGLMVVGAMIGLSAAHWLMKLTVLRRNLWLGGACISLAIGVPMNVLVMFAGWMTGLGAMSLERMLILAPTVFLVSAATTAIGLMARGADPVATHMAREGAAPPKFLERLPAKLTGAEIWAVEAEDHYLRLHTSKGQDMILMRLSDAVTELEGIEGAQVHRSWWVARDGFEDAEKSEGRATLTLKDGALAPVSRAYARALRQDGWF